MTKTKVIQEKVLLNFRVDPSYLKERTVVRDPVKIVSTGRNPLAFMKLKRLNESGLEMWLRGFPFEFTKKKANELIRKGFAEVYRKKLPYMFA